MNTRALPVILVLIFTTSIIIVNSAIASDIEMFLQAVKSGDVEEVKRLIEKGVDVNESTNNGCTALMGASLRGHIDIVNLLREAGAEED